MTRAAGTLTAALQDVKTVIDNALGAYLPLSGNLLDVARTYSLDIAEYRVLGGAS